MLASTSSLLLPLVLAAGLGSTSTVHHDVQAYVTGYNTIPGQTDSTPCLAASGADICGRRDAVACPRRISLGTTVQIHGATYICEDRLAKKFDTRFDISCDKDTTCPPQVTGWTTIRVYDDPSTEKAPPPVTKTADLGPAKHKGHLIRLVHLVHSEHDAHHPANRAKPAATVAQRLRRVLKVAAILRGRG